MKKTLLAMGVAVLASMLFTPHEQDWQWLGRMFYVELSDAEKGAHQERVFSEMTNTWQNWTAYNRSSYVPDWCKGWYRFPIFCQDRIGYRIIPKAMLLKIKATVESTCRITRFGKFTR